MKFSKSFLSNLNLTAAVINASVCPSEHNMRTASECFSAQLDEVQTAPVTEAQILILETHVQLA